MELTYKARQMIKVGEEIGGHYDLEMGAYKNDIKLLGKLVGILSDTDYNEGLNYIDEQLDNGKKILDIYTEIFEEMNKKAFFTNPLSASTEVMPIDLEKLTQEVMEKAQAEMTQGQTDKIIKNMSKALEE